MTLYDNGYESTIQFILRYAKRWEKTTPIGIVDYNTNL